MADRYWVGGTGTWDASTTTNWATTSGGAGGASAPTSADNAYFDGASDAGAPFAVTLGTGAVCADVIIGDGSTVTVLDQTMTLAGSALWSIHGSVFFPATNLTYTASSYVAFRGSGSHTITPNGLVFPRQESDITTTTGSYTLGGALSNNGQRFIVYTGTFDTANYSATLGAFETRNGGLKNVTFGSSFVSCSIAGSTAFSIADAGNVTLSAASSDITVSANGGFTGGGKTFGNVRFTGFSNPSIRDGGSTFANLTFSQSGTSAASGAFAIFGSNTVTGQFNVMSGFGATFDITDTAGAITAATVNSGGFDYNVGDIINVTGGNGDAQLTVATLSGSAIATVTISTPGTGYTTATGVATTLATSALNPNRRVLIASDTLGTARTITAAAVNITNADFRNITGAGAATWSDSGRTRYWGNCLGNSGITFSAGVSKYRIGTGNWSATQWAATSGGAAAVGNFPLAQDTCVFDANTTTGTHTIDASYNIGSLNMSALTVAVTLATGSTAPTFYGNVTLDADVTLTGTGTFTFAGQGTTQTITSAGRTFTQPLTVNSPSGTATLADNAITNGSFFTLTAGTLNINDKILTCLRFSSSNTNNRTIAFGATGEIQVTSAPDDSGSVSLSLDNMTNLSVSGSRTIKLTSTNTSSARMFLDVGHTGGVSDSNAIDLYVTGGSYRFWVYRSVYVRTLNFTGYAGLVDGEAGPDIGLYGNLVLSPTQSQPIVPLAFIGSSVSSRTVSTNGVVYNSSVNINTSGSVVLQDNFSLGASQTLTLTQGTLDLNSRTLAAQNFSSSNSNTRVIAFGTGGGITLSGSGTVFNATTGTNLTTTGTGVIDLTSASTKTFAGGGRTYPTLNQGGSGTLLITGANTFADITNTVQPTTITFPSGVTTSVQDFSVGGTLGNLVTLNASTPGTRAILNRV